MIYRSLDHNITLCLICKNLHLLGNQPKFEILNSLLYADCQSYLLLLADLFMAKKTAIICAHPFISIFKLRLSENFNPAAYCDIKGYALSFLQNLALLLTFFPCLILALHNVICIIWARQKRSTNLDLKYFILIKKQTFFNLLTWLRINNLLY